VSPSIPSVGLVMCSAVECISNAVSDRRPVATGWQIA